MVFVFISVETAAPPSLWIPHLILLDVKQKMPEVKKMIILKSHFIVEALF